MNWCCYLHLLFILNILQFLVQTQRKFSNLFILQKNIWRLFFLFPYPWHMSITWSMWEVFITRVTPTYQTLLECRVWGGISLKFLSRNYSQSDWFRDCLINIALPVWNTREYLLKNYFGTLYSGWALFHLKFLFMWLLWS